MPKYIPTTQDELRQDGSLYLIVSALALCTVAVVAVAYMLAPTSAPAMPMVRHNLQVGDHYRIPITIMGVEFQLEGTIEKIEPSDPIPVFEERWPSIEQPAQAQPVKVLPLKRRLPPPQINTPWNQVLQG